MKKFFLFTNLFILCLVMGFSAHATDVCGLILEDTTWTKVSSPYIVTCDVTVLAGITLTIEPGVEVKFNAKLSLIIHGTLIARGTESDKIIFTSNGNQTPGYWRYIFFSDTSKDATFDPDYTGGCIIQYATVEYGGSGNSVITIDKSSPFIDKSVITNNVGSGIYINSGYPTIKDSTISENYNAWDGGGIYASNCNKGTITIQNSTISGNEADFDGGGISASSSTIIIKNSTISGNDAWFKGGIEASSSTITIEGSTISDNHSDDAGGIYASSSTITIENSTIHKERKEMYFSLPFLTISSFPIKTFSASQLSIFGVQKLCFCTVHQQRLMHSKVTNFSPFSIHPKLPPLAIFANLDSSLSSVVYP